MNNEWIINGWWWINEWIINEYEWNNDNDDNDMMDEWMMMMDVMW